MTKIFYTYLYLREDGTPYYVGKGTGTRAFCRDPVSVKPPRNRSRIIIQEFPTETEAFEAEVLLISFYGRKDIGTGCLRNKTDGGEGSSGKVVSVATRNRISTAKVGKKLPNRVQLTNKGRFKQGHKHSEDTVQKLSESLSLYLDSSEGKLSIKTRAERLRKHKSKEEHRAARRLANKRYRDRLRGNPTMTKEEQRQWLSLYWQGHKVSEDTKKKISLSLIKRSKELTQ